MSCIITHEIQSYPFYFAIAKENISIANNFFNYTPSNPNPPTLKNRFIGIIQAFGLALKAALLCLPLINKITRLSSKETTLAAVSKNGMLLEHVPIPLKEAIDVVQAAVAQNPEALRFASKEPTLAAVSKNGMLLEHVPIPLKEAIDVVQAAIAQNPEALRFASKKVAVFFVTQEGEFLKCVSEDLKGDKEIVRLAITPNQSMFQYASDKLKEDEDFILEFIPEVSNPEYENFRTNTSKLLANCSPCIAFEYVPKILKHTSKKLKENADFMTRAVEKSHWTFLECASKEIEDAVLKAMLNKNKDLSALKRFTKDKVYSEAS